MQLRTSRSFAAEWIQLGTWLAALALLLAVGYLGFRAFAGAADPGTANLYALPLLAGVAGFFSPCAFPLLPSYLAFYYRTREAKADGGGSMLWLGGSAALGVVSFALLLGAFIGLFGAGLGQALSVSGSDPSLPVRVFRGAVGLALVVLGIGQLANWNLKPELIDAFVYRVRPEREGRRRPAHNLFLYGFGYTAAGVGCTGPILAGLIILAVASGGFKTALLAFGLFALTMGALMLIVSALVAGSRRALISRLKQHSQRLQRAASLLVILAGLFNLATAIAQDLFQQLLFPG